LRSVSLLFAVLVSTPALAADLYLESPDLGSRRDAEGAVEAAEDAGLDARVVRRLGQGSGWQYVVRVEGLTDTDEAVDAAEELASAVGRAVGVYALDSGTATLLEEVASPSPIDPVRTLRGPIDAPEVDEVEDALPYLERAAAAHRVEGLDLDHQPVHFEFRRLLPEGGVADHTFAMRDGALYLEVEKVSGDVVPSRVKIVEERAWLSVDGGPWTEQNVEKAEQTAHAMGPTKVLPFVLVLDAAMDSRRELQRMETAGSTEVDGAEVDVLDFAGDQAAGPVRVLVGRSEPLVHEVLFDAGALIYRFADHGKVGAFRLPREVVTERDSEVVDRVEIEALEVGAKMPDAWFAAP